MRRDVYTVSHDAVAADARLQNIECLEVPLPHFFAKAAVKFVGAEALVVRVRWLVGNVEEIDRAAVFKPDDVVLTVQAPITARDAVVGNRRRADMDKDRIEGAGKNLKGKIKEGVGKVTGDTKTEAEGKFDQAEGKAQNTVGGMKDKARELIDDK